MFVRSVIYLYFFSVFAALEYHNLNTSIATRDFWVITGRDVIVFLQNM